jgi:hypothetical protein
VSRPVYSAVQVASAVLQASVPPSWRIIPACYIAEPLGTASADSRFCAKSDGYTILYCAPDFATAFIETVVRDRFTRTRRRRILLKEVTARVWVLVGSAHGVRLRLLDLRGAGCTTIGAPTDTVGARNHAAGRAFGRAIHRDHNEIDGFQYKSRLTGADVYAVYDRAIGKLEAVESGRLADHRELPNVLRRHQIRLSD